MVCRRIQRLILAGGQSSVETLETRDGGVAFSAPAIMHDLESRMPSFWSEHLATASRPGG